MKFFQVDAFAEKAFEGNPAAVFLTEQPLAVDLMQNIAREMNLSETAFLVPRQGGYHLRWFTPEAEVELCGHATLASAHVLYETGQLSKGEKGLFSTLSGELRTEYRDGKIMMDFPATPASPTAPLPDLEKALGTGVKEVLKNQFDYMAVLENEKSVRSLAPDMTLLEKFECRGVIVTAPGGDGYDFVSRFFAPAVGVPEDPVTGSAHCTLGPYWQKKSGKSSFTARQISRRGGTVQLQVTGERVILGGSGVTTVSGELIL